MFEARIIRGVKKVHHSRVFLNFSIPDDPGRGFIFDADDYGNPVIKCPEADKSFSLCIEKQYPCEIVHEEWDSFTYPILKCICGAEIHCSGEGHYGAWECDKCNRWFNRGGQLLNPPEMWEEQLEPID